MCVATPGRIVSIGQPSTASVPAEVVFSDRTLTVNLVMVPDAVVGDYIVVHSGYAIRITHEPITPGGIACEVPGVVDG